MCDLVGAIKLIDTFNSLRYDRDRVLWDFILLLNVNPINIHRKVSERD